MKKSSEPAAVGRPRAFDTDVALEKAMQVFWRQGYEGASLTDLTEAMGINRPSLYAAFGNKEELFRKALDLYISGFATHLANALNQPTAREVIARLLHSTASLLGDPRLPRGCLAVQSALCCSIEADMARQEARARRLQGQELLRQRFERARTEGDLPASIDPADLARHVSIITSGLSIQSTNGATPEELKRAAEFALKALPL